MSVRQRVSREQILAVLGATQGNVSAAARALGMHRNNLYKRLIGMGLNPDTVRLAVPSGSGVAGAAHGAPAATNATDAHQRQSGAAQHPSRSRARSSANESSVAIFPTGRGGSSFAAVSINAAADEQTPDRALRATKSLFLRPEQIKALEGATYDLSFRFRERFSPSRVLERFMDECFTDWLRGVMAGSSERPTSRKPNGKAEKKKGGGA